VANELSWPLVYSQVPPKIEIRE